MYWEEEHALILSDLHLGKTGHFRKAGIAVPQAVFKEDMQRLVTLVQQFSPRQLIIIGDMFHSHSNKEHDFFLRWRNDFDSLPIRLVRGNHDILSRKWYDIAGIELMETEFRLGKFIFAHDHADCTAAENCYLFSGHIHPGISVSTGIRQSLHFPCFYFAEDHAVMPAFSRFTGTASIRPKKGEKVVAIVEGRLMAMEA